MKRTIQTTDQPGWQPMRAQAFTILELVITIAIAGILVAIAIPSFTDTIKDNRLTTRTNDIVEAFNVARQIAISRNTTTMVCHSANANVDDPDCGGTGSSWSTGNIVYSVGPRTRVTSERDYTAGDSIVQKADLSGGTVTAIGTDSEDFVSFTSSGLLFSSDEIVIQVCDDRTGEEGRLITVTRAGRITTTAAEGTNACA